MKPHLHIFICFFLFPLLVSCGDRNDFVSLLQSGIKHYEAGEMEAAMQDLTDAEDHINGDVSSDMQGALYLHRGCIYNSLLLHDRAIPEIEKALALFEESGRTDKYYRAVSLLCDTYIMVDDAENARRCFDILDGYRDSLGTYDLHLYHLWKIKIAALESGPAETVPYIEEYLTSMPNDGNVPWRILAYYMNEAGEHSRAMELIVNEARFNDVRNDQNYLYVRSQIKRNLGDIEGAYDDLIRSSEIDDSLEQINMHSDTHFIQERHSNLQDARMRNRIIWLCTFVILMTLYALWETRKRLVANTKEKVRMQIEKERLEKLYAEALVERDSLRKMAEAENTADEMKIVIKQRLALLNKVIASYITDSPASNKEANEQIEFLISDREAFLESTRKSFEAGHPKFMAYLRSRTLTDWEVNYCCLYLVGLNGKEIGEYINLKRHYTYGSVIRQKLGLGEHDRNLANHLKMLLENPPASNSVSEA